MDSYFCTCIPASRGCTNDLLGSASRLVRDEQYICSMGISLVEYTDKNGHGINQLFASHLDLEEVSGSEKTFDYCVNLHRNIHGIGSDK